MDEKTVAGNQGSRMQKGSKLGLNNGLKTRKRALEQWETALANTEETPQAIWPIAKSLTNRDGPRAPTAIHGLLGLTVQLLTVWNISSHHMPCVRKIINSGWRLGSKLCSTLKITNPLKEQDHVTCRN
jgi:hypothetical protein